MGGGEKIEASGAENTPEIFWSGGSSQTPPELPGGKLLEVCHRKFMPIMARDPESEKAIAEERCDGEDGYVKQCLKTFGSDIKKCLILLGEAGPCSSSDDSRQIPTKTILRSEFFSEHPKINEFIHGLLHKTHPYIRNLRIINGWVHDTQNINMGAIYALKGAGEQRVNVHIDTARQGGVCIGTSMLPADNLGDAEYVIANAQGKGDLLLDRAIAFQDIYYKASGERPLFAYAGIALGLGALYLLGTFTLAFYIPTIVFGLTAPLLQKRLGLTDGFPGRPFKQIPPAGNGPRTSSPRPSPPPPVKPFDDKGNRPPPVAEGPGPQPVFEYALPALAALALVGVALYTLPIWAPLGGAAAAAGLVTMTPSLRETNGSEAI